MIFEQMLKKTLTEMGCQMSSQKLLVVSISLIFTALSSSRIWAVQRCAGMLARLDYHYKNQTDQDCIAGICPIEVKGGLIQTATSNGPATSRFIHPRYLDWEETFFPVALLDSGELLVSDGRHLIHEPLLKYAEARGLKIIAVASLKTMQGKVTELNTFSFSDHIAPESLDQIEAGLNKKGIDTSKVTKRIVPDGEMQLPLIFKIPSR